MAPLPSVPGEPRWPPLEERRDPLGVVGGGAGPALEVRLQLELLLEGRSPRRASSASFVSARARGAPAASRSASACASAGSSSAGTTRATSPNRSASAADSGSPMSASSAAFAAPTSRGRSHVAPLSGTSPTRPNASRKLAPSAAIRMSQANASDAPAPAATPLIAADDRLRQPPHRADDRVVAVADLVARGARVRARAAP